MNYSYKDNFRRECKENHNNNYECHEIIKKCFNEYIIENEIIEECIQKCSYNKYLRMECDKYCNNYEFDEFNNCIESYKKSIRKKYFRK